MVAKQTCLTFCCDLVTLLVVRGPPANRLGFVPICLVGGSVFPVKPVPLGRPSILSMTWGPLVLTACCFWYLCAVGTIVCRQLWYPRSLSSRIVFRWLCKLKFWFLFSWWDYIKRVFKFSLRSKSADTAFPLWTVIEIPWIMWLPKDSYTANTYSGSTVECSETTVLLKKYSRLPQTMLHCIFYQ